MTCSLDMPEDSNFLGCCMVLPGNWWSTFFRRSLFLLWLNFSGQKSTTFLESSVITRIYQWTWRSVSKD